MIPMPFDININLFVSDRVSLRCIDASKLRSAFALIVRIKRVSLMFYPLVVFYLLICVIRNRFYTIGITVP